MNLRKALDKAKQSRGEISAQEDAKVSEKKPPVPRKEREESILNKAASVELNSDKLIENRCLCVTSDAQEVEMYKVIRTQIQQRTQEKGWNTVMITSALAGEGKTLTSINLALTFAKEINRRVLLVDCDLKRQDIHKRLGFPNPKGVINYIVDDCPISDLLIKPKIKGVKGLTVISGGKTVRDSTELLGSPKMKTFMDEIRSLYKEHYIIFEAPPILGGADAVAFAPLVDSVVLVVEAGRTSTQDVKKAVEFIPEEKFLGFVLNRMKLSTKEYAPYGYGLE